MLCRGGNLEKVKAYIEKHINDEILPEMVANRRGVFGYTSLHEAVASGKADILDYLLTRTKDAHVNGIANSGYTPLHLAVSSGNLDCVKTLLDHGGDISLTDEYGKTPRNIAELCCKPGVLRLLVCEGE